MSLRPGWKTQPAVDIGNRDPRLPGTETQKVRDLVAWVIIELRSKQGPGIQLRKRGQGEERVFPGPRGQAHQWKLDPLPLGLFVHSWRGTGQKGSEDPHSKLNSSEWKRGNLHFPFLHPI